MPGAAPERQGAGALEVGLAVSIALAERHRRRRPVATGPRIATGGVIFELHDDRALCVDVFGSWDQFTTSVSARSDGTGGWATDSLLLGPGEHHYKFRLDTAHWLADPCNPRRAHDGAGGLNSVFHLPAS